MARLLHQVVRGGFTLHVRKTLPPSFSGKRLFNDKPYQPSDDECTRGEDGKHPDMEKEPLKKWPGGINPYTGERGGPAGPEPTRYGDWERKGRVSDFFQEHQHPSPEPEKEQDNAFWQSASFLNSFPLPAALLLLIVVVGNNFAT